MTGSRTQHLTVAQLNIFTSSLAKEIEACFYSAFPGIEIEKVEFNDDPEPTMRSIQYKDPVTIVKEIKDQMSPFFHPEINRSRFFHQETNQTNMPRDIEMSVLNIARI